MAGALMACTAARTGAECTPAEGEEAELSVWKGGRSWDGLYEHYRRYGACDDGAVFEGYTEAIATLTTERWDTIGRVGTLVKRDRSFEPFVVKHVKKLVVDSTRHIRWISRGILATEADIPLPKVADQGFIRKLWCAAADGDALMVYQADYFGPGGDFKGGGALRITRRRGNAIVWTAASEGNVGEPSRYGKSIYVTGIGFVGKLDEESGRYLWKHGGLYRAPGIYVAFGKPEIDRGLVRFPGVHHNEGNPIPRDWPSAVIVDDSSGAIVGGTVSAD